MSKVQAEKVFSSPSDQSLFDQKLKYEITKVLLLLGVPSNILYILFCILRHRDGDLIAQAFVSLVVFVGAALFYITRDPVLTTTVVCVLEIPAVAFRTWYMGGLSSPSIIGPLMATTVCALVLPFRRALVLSSMHIFIVVGFFLWKLTGHDLPSRMHSDSVNILGFLLTMTLAGVLFLVILKDRFQRNAHVENLTSQRDAKVMLLKDLVRDISKSLSMIQYSLENTESQTTHTERIEQATTRIEKVLMSVRELELSKRDHGQTVKNVVSLVDAIDRSLDLVRSEARAKNIVFVRDIVDLEAKVQFDSDILTHHVLVNILNSAIRFSPEAGQIKLGIAYDRNFWTVYVSGLGLKRTEDEVGAGFGLLIVDAMVRAYGGSLHVDSKPWSGTRVSLNLPRA